MHARAPSQQELARSAGWHDELAAALAAAGEAAEIIRHHYEHGSEIWHKNGDENDPVTRADLEADRVIDARLRGSFPGDGILSEESAQDSDRSGKRRVWIVDPMDGTHEFRDRVPEFAVSIALCVDGDPVVGVVANPIERVTVSAVRGGGTWRDGERMRVSDCSRLSEARLIASRSETKRGDLDAFEGWFASARPMGSIAWKLSAVACGLGDLNVSVRPKQEWDVCAGDLLVREAGGVYRLADGATRVYNASDSGVPAGAAAGPEALVEAFLERARALAGS